MNSSGLPAVIPAVVTSARSGRRPAGAWLRGLVVDYRRAFVGLIALAIATGAYALAMALRFDLTLPSEVVAILIATLPPLLACKLVGFWSAGLFGGWWRHVNLRDVVDIVRGNILGSMLFLSPWCSDRDWGASRARCFCSISCSARSR